MTTQFDAFADFPMQGHHAVITGGAQNIGAGVARTLVGAGANVMIADLQGDKAKETAARIAAETGGRCLGMACDVTRSEDIDAVVAASVAARSRRWSLRMTFWPTAPPRRRSTR